MRRGAGMLGIIVGGICGSFIIGFICGLAGFGYDSVKYAAPIGWTVGAVTGYFCCTRETHEREEPENQGLPLRSRIRAPSAASDTTICATSAQPGRPGFVPLTATESVVIDIPIDPTAPKGSEKFKNSEQWLQRRQSELKVFEQYARNPKISDKERSENSDLACRTKMLMKRYQQIGTNLQEAKVNASNPSLSPNERKNWEDKALGFAERLKVMTAPGFSPDSESQQSELKILRPGPVMPAPPTTVENVVIDIPIDPTAPKGSEKFEKSEQWLERRQSELKVHEQFARNPQMSEKERSENGDLAQRTKVLIKRYHQAGSELQQAKLNASNLSFTPEMRKNWADKALECAERLKVMTAAQSSVGADSQGSVLPALQSYVADFESWFEHRQSELMTFEEMARNETVGAEERIKNAVLASRTKAVMKRYQEINKELKQAQERANNPDLPPELRKYWVDKASDCLERLKTLTTSDTCEDTSFQNDNQTDATHLLAQNGAMKDRLLETI